MLGNLKKIKNTMTLAKGVGSTPLGAPLALGGDEFFDK